MLKNTLKAFSTVCSIATEKFVLQKSVNIINPIHIQINKFTSPASALYLSKLIPTDFIQINNQRYSSSITNLLSEPVPDKLYARICCELRANDPEVMKSYSIFALSAAKHLNLEIGECYAQKKAHHKRYTLLRSVHVVKRCRVQYEVRTYFRWMNFHKLTGSTADTFLEYIQRNLPEGVALKVTKYEVQKLPKHLVPPEVLENKIPEISAEVK